MMLHAMVAVAQGVARQDAVHATHNWEGMVKSCRYTVHNSDTCSVVVLLTEDDNTSMPRERLLMRKLCRPYGDMSLGMLAWDNVVAHYDYVPVPELFVKTVAPDESFDVIVQGTDSTTDELLEDFARHILVIPEDEVKRAWSSSYAMFLREFNLEYTAAYVVIDIKSFYEDFVDKKR